MLTHRRRSARRLVLALSTFLLAACGGDGGTSTPAVTPPPASVLVPQVGPGPRLQSYGWIHGGPLAYVTTEGTFWIWDTAANRILYLRAFSTESLSAFSTESRRVFVGPTSVRFGATLVSLTTGEEVALTHPEGSVLAPSLDRSAEVLVDERRELVLYSLEGETARVGVSDVSLAFAPDGRHIATCSREGIQLRRTDGGAWVRGWDGSADGGCRFVNERLIVAYHDEYVVHTGGSSTATLLDASTLRPLGAPLRDATHVVASPDGSRLAMIVRGQLVIVDTATQRESARPGVQATLELVTVGDTVVTDPREPTATQVSLTTGEVLQRGGPIDTRALRADGTRLALVGNGDAARLSVVSPTGAPLVRLDLPALAELGVEAPPTWSPAMRGLTERDAVLVAYLGETTFTFDAALVARPVASCRPRPPVPSAVPEPVYGRREFALERVIHSAFVPTEDGRAFLLSTDCIGRNGAAAVRGPFDPYAISGDHRSFVSIESGAIVVRGVDGSARATLALEAGEEPPCESATCGMPIELSHDGAWVAVARDAELRLFDASTGVGVGRARVSPRTRQLAFAPDGTWLVHVGADGRRTRFDVPGLRPLARWAGPPDPYGQGPVVFLTADAVVDGNVSRSLSGTPIAGPWPDLTDASRMSLVAGHLVRATYGHALAPPGAPRPEVRRTDIASLPGLEVVSELAGAWAAATPTDVFSCDESADILTWTSLSGPPRSRVIEGGCPTLGVVALGTTALAIRDGDLGIRLVRRSDGAMRRVIAVTSGAGIRLVPLDGGGDRRGVEFSLRRPRVESEGMIAAPATEGSLEAWLAAGAEAP
ncbi:MAG: hypothetical protein IPG17_34075 [Sandaracinaceae bacterium]|nr:hypothetical protein [Sandaracinaceae bacterium]MBP7683229.1 hypothetical protein [Deltaproteobacteria bacterium]MBK6808729.1 hypothetical protein [Sandaracinaceae bacterium]MBK7150301.1 hypothetical protein [Sandaracinaceae bacterium]MBK7774367.1 hypothetical protein [Sandaracinaceae bacterium]